MPLNQRLVIQLAHILQVLWAKDPVEVGISLPCCHFPPEIKRQPVIERVGIETSQIGSEFHQKINRARETKQLARRRVTVLRQPLRFVRLRYQISQGPQSSKAMQKKSRRRSASDSASSRGRSSTGRPSAA